MNIILNPILLFIIICVLFYWYLRRVTQKPSLLRGDFIQQYDFPQAVSQKLQQSYPHLDEQQIEQIISGLRSYFQICNWAVEDGDELAMPSQAVDTAWHEFIAHTKLYEDFCQQAFGQFLYHTPAEGMLSQTQAQATIKTTHEYTCRLYQLSTKSPEKLPLLFALDAQLNIPDGFNYSLDCRNKNGHFCFSHIGRRKK